MIGLFYNQEDHYIGKKILSPHEETENLIHISRGEISKYCLPGPTTVKFPDDFKRKCKFMGLGPYGERIFKEV